VLVAVIVHVDTDHELRHTAASLTIASGADIKIVQQMLGHKSATMTLDQYGHLFGDRLDIVADAMDAARTSALSKTDGGCWQSGSPEMRRSSMTERELERRAQRRLAVLRHVEEVSGNVAATCRYYGISRQCYYG
jgi:hypothetical protein